jgi:ABC-type nitrate/sulfonate/bicarbonate transport system permease component
MKRSIYIGPSVLLLLWLLLHASRTIDPFLLPSPFEAFRALYVGFGHEGLILDVLMTIKRIVMAFGLATGVGLPIGLALGSSKSAYGRVEFLVDFFRSMPALALFPLFMIIFGIGDLSKILVSAFGAGMVIVFNVAYGLMHSKKSRILAAQMMGASKWKVFVSVIFWETMPDIFVGLRNGMSWTIAVIIATEMFVGTNFGIGHKIIDYQISYNMPAVYASILMAGVVGYLLNYIFVIIERRVLHWSGK